MKVRMKNHRERRQGLFFLRRVTTNQAHPGRQPETSVWAAARADTFLWNRSPALSDTVFSIAGKGQKVRGGLGFPQKWLINL